MSISTNKVYHNLAFSEKDNFLNFVYKLGEMGLKRIFKFPKEEFSLWWFSLIAEKPPLKTDSYEKLISFLVQPNKRTQRKGFKEQAKNIIFLQFLYGLFYFCYSLLRTIRFKTKVMDFPRRKERLHTCNYIIVSYFPHLNKALAEKGIFEDRYIASLNRILREKHKNDYAHICLQVNIDGYNLKDAICFANKLMEDQQIFFIEEFFKLRHIFYIIFYYLYFSFKFLIHIKWIKKNVIYEYKSTKYNVWHIFRKDFYNSFCGSVLMSSLWYIFLFRELIRSLNKSSKILCVCEMQWWEKALYIYAKKYGIVTVGIQHSIVPELVLNYFNASQEIGDGDFMKNYPLPDYLATVGDITTGQFRRYGWPNERLFIWGAQRFELLKNQDGFSLSWQDKRDYFVCALSINISENEKLLLLLERAFRKNVNFRVILKGHPTINLQKMINRLNLKFNLGVFEITDYPIADIIKKAKGIIVMESSSCFYALACNIPIIIPRFQDKLDCNPLSYISDIPIYVYSEDDLRSICNQIIQSSMSPVPENRGREFLRKYLYFPKHDNDYLEKIDSICR